MEKQIPPRKCLFSAQARRNSGRPPPHLTQRQATIVSRPQQRGAQGGRVNPLFTDLCVTFRSGSPRPGPGAARRSFPIQERWRGARVSIKASNSGQISNNLCAMIVHCAHLKCSKRIICCAAERSEAESHFGNHARGLTDSAAQKDAARRRRGAAKARVAQSRPPVPQPAAAPPGACRAAGRPRGPPRRAAWPQRDAGQ